MKKLFILIFILLLLLVAWWLFSGQSHQHHDNHDHGSKVDHSHDHEHQSEKVSADSLVNNINAGIAPKEQVVFVDSGKDRPIPSTFSVNGGVIKNGWVREPIPGSSVTAAYFDIELDKAIRIGGKVTSPQFERAELHEMSENESGVMSMNELGWAKMNAPKDSLVPGGRHIMLFNPKGQLKEGDLVEVTFDIAERARGRVTVTLPVVAGK